MKINRAQGHRAARWILFISNRFSKVDRKGRTAVTSVLSSLGVCFGVMALIVVISVMNGFQLEFIDAIMEISSYHVRVTDVESEPEFMDWCSHDRQLVSVTPFYEAQGLMVGSGGKESAALVRAVPGEIKKLDSGFDSQLKMLSGRFDLTEDNSIILGSELARSIGARVGGSVNIFALSGSADTALFSQDREFVVKGIFYSNYSDINAAYSFVNIDAGKKHFGSTTPRIYGVKLKDKNRDAAFVSRCSANFPGSLCSSWREYNRTFFGALRVEKNILMLLVFLIFVVVAINIYNAMRRMVYERREDIAVLTALGARKTEVQLVFVLKGFLTGLAGAVPGLLLGMLICINMDVVFVCLSKGQYYLQYFFAMLFNPSAGSYLQENPMFRIYANIPARMILGEVAAIFFFGIFSSFTASWIASRKILKLTVAEVLHDD